MAPKSLILLFTLLCAVQFGTCASLERRDLISDLLNQSKQVETAIQKLLQPLFNSINDAMSKGQGLVSSLTQQQNQVLAASQGPLQNILQGFNDAIKKIFGNVIDYNKNVTTCVTGQYDNAKGIVQVAAKNIFACTQTQVQQAVQVFQDIADLNNQAINLTRQGISTGVGCFQNISNLLGCEASNLGTVASRGGVIGTAIAQDLGKLALQGIALPKQLMQCGNDQIAKATTSVGNLISDIGKCAQNFAQNS